MEQKSWLPVGGANLFQEIKRVRSEAEDKGVKILNLSIGQPQGPALLSAREHAAQAVMSGEESMHEYQDNGSPGVANFAKRFVLSHVPTLESYAEELGFLPIPGIKPMLGLIPLACDLAIGDPGFRRGVLTTTNPGYPTPADWCRYLGIKPQEPSLNPKNSFRFPVGIEYIPIGIKLVMINYPHNPSGQVATWEWLRNLCEHCEERNIRIFNDAAYFGLSYNQNSWCLSQVATGYPNLSWAEAFSASKIIGNGTGWRVGAIVGSKDFVDDIAKIKGNTDSGFVAPMASGALYALENDREGISEIRDTYQRRIGLLRTTLQPCGMQLAVEPGAGFFTLWKAPKKAFGEEMREAAHFNFTMIERTGVTGVHFNPDYIRYAVCGDVEAMLGDIGKAFVQAAVEY